MNSTKQYVNSKPNVKLLFTREKKKKKKRAENIDVTKRGIQTLTKRVTCLTSLST